DREGSGHHPGKAVKPRPSPRRPSTMISTLRTRPRALAAGLAVLLAAAAPLKDDPKEKPKEDLKKGETLKYTDKVTHHDTSKGIKGATVTVRRSVYGDPTVKEDDWFLQETKHTTDADGKYSFTIPPEQSSQRYLYIEVEVAHDQYASWGPA